MSPSSLKKRSGRGTAAVCDAVSIHDEVRVPRAAANALMARGPTMLTTEGDEQWGHVAT